MKPEKSEIKSEPVEVKETPVVKQEKSDKKEKSDITPTVIMTDTDAYIHERLKSQPKSLSEIESKVVVTRTEGEHVLSLPKELNKYGKKFAFRWINKKKRSIDHAIDVIGWSLIQRTVFPDLPDHLFTANGVIERGDAVLAFMLEKNAEVIRRRPGEISRERVRNLPVQDLKKWQDRGENYYKPDLGSAESDSDSEYAKGNKGIVVQPDVATIEE